MHIKSFRLNLIGAGAAILAAGVLAAPPAVAADKINMSLPWSIGGSSNGVFLGIDRGYFKDEGIDLSVVPGNGSSNTVNRVASGAFQFGTGDTPSIVRFNSLNPGSKIKAVYNHQPSDLTIVTLKSTGISKPADLKGKIIGAPTGDTAYKMFAAFTAATGVTAADLKWEHMAPNVREVMLIQKKVDAITASEATAYFALKSAGIKDEDMVFMTYPSVGVKLAGGTLMTSEALIKSNPDLVKRFVRAYNRSFIAGIADLKAAVEATLKREPLLKFDLELEKGARMDGSITRQMTQIGKGYGAFTDELIQGTIETLKITEGLPTPVTVADIYDSSFLPPQAERMRPASAAASK